MAAEVSVRELAPNRDSAPSQTRETSPAAELFQKAHARMMVLQRLDEQLSQLLAQRRQLQQELLTLQERINDEFERVMNAARDFPAKLLTQIVNQGKDGHASAPAVASAPVIASAPAPEPPSRPGIAPAWLRPAPQPVRAGE